jgi:hypothetical protein
MNKILFFAGVALLLSFRSPGQTGFNDSLALSRNTLTKNVMLGLGGFAVANIATGFIAAGQTRGETRNFWRMNAYWNLVNLGVAAMGYLGAQRALGRTYSLTQNERAQLSVEKTYVLNFGLDLVYITGGFYLRERGLSESNTVSRDQYRGYGSSIAVQGGFLAVMDGLMVMLHHRNSMRLNKHLQGLELRMGPGSLGLVYNL